MRAISIVSNVVVILVQIVVDVPHGSVMESTLLSMYINELSDVLSKTITDMFADDTFNSTYFKS